MNHNSLGCEQPSRPRCRTITQCAGRVSANARPLQLCWGDRECGCFTPCTYNMYMWETYVMATHQLWNSTFVYIHIICSLPVCTCMYMYTCTSFYCAQVNGYEDILVETMNLCCHYFEQHMYMVPKEKYMLLKVCVVWSCASHSTVFMFLYYAWIQNVTMRYRCDNGTMLRTVLRWILQQYSKDASLVPLWYSCAVLCEGYHD